jgi:PadR family transcriptional regulator, regulatory protein PadR
VTASKSKVKVLNVFLEEPAEEQYGFGVIHKTRLQSGVVYPLLDRLERDGWIEGFDEDIDEHAEGRPKRRLYRLTAVGKREAVKAVAVFYADLEPRPSWLPGLQPLADVPRRSHRGLTGGNPRLAPGKGW